ncbi:hypothetical protein [Streptomyces sp. AD55]|uniref:hypothetical protein n=1 Tax=Streptomyces sp. AD55 TaxID=3242895 RepID=UPI003526E42E
MGAWVGCRRVVWGEGGVVYAWEDGDGGSGHVLVDPEGEVVRPCTARGSAVGAMALRRRAGCVEQPDPRPEARRAFLLVASVIFQEWRRRGRPPETVTRTYW